MIENEIEIQLSAHADGELAPAERAALETRLAADPALTRMLARFKALATAAQAEPIPTAFHDTDRAWPALADRALSFPLDVSGKLNQLARAETCPVMSGECARRAWKGIVGRALHSFSAEHLHVAPKVSEENWSDAWKKITTRARIVAIPEPQRAAVATPSNVVSLPKARAVSIWSWAAGVGLAAAAMLAIVLSTPHTEDLPATGDSMAMAIPESQDDRYGVLVKYVPGSDDPMIVLYEKEPDLNK